MKTSQTTRLLELLSDGLPHRTDNILQVVYGSEHLGIARIGARIADLRETYEIIGYKCPERKSLYFYKLLGPKKVEIRQEVLAI